MLDEAKNINKSLSSLGNVISALAEGSVSTSTSPLLRLSSGDLSVDYCVLKLEHHASAISLFRSNLTVNLAGLMCRLSACLVCSVAHIFQPSTGFCAAEIS